MSGSIYDYVSPSGVVVPDTTTLLEEVQDEWTGTFGTGVNLDSATPQGLMISSEVAARSGVTQNNAQVANQINPNVAGGVFLDAICALTGLVREANTTTIVPGIQLTGVPNSPIAAGSLAKTPNGDQFALQADVTLDPISGNAVGTFLAIEPGPVLAPAGAWTVFSSVLGWETVSNPAPGVPGTLQQPDETLRVTRRQTLAKQGSSFMEAILSSVSALTGVIGRQGLENDGAAATIQTIPMLANSVWVCVDGGDQTDIAMALLENKSGGAPWNGAVVVNVTEPASGQVYAVKLDRPALVPVLCRITVKQQNFVGDVQAAVTTAILDFAANNITGIQGFTVGESASPFEIAGGVAAECAGIYIQKVELALVSAPTYAVAELPMNINQKATVISGDITVLVVT